MVFSVKYVRGIAVTNPENRRVIAEGFVATLPRPGDGVWFENQQAVVIGVEHVVPAGIETAKVFIVVDFPRGDD